MLRTSTSGTCPIGRRRLLGALWTGRDYGPRNPGFAGSDDLTGTSDSPVDESGHSYSLCPLVAGGPADSCATPTFCVFIDYGGNAIVGS